MIEKILKRIVNEYFKGKTLSNAINKVLDKLSDDESRLLYQELEDKKNKRELLGKR